ncbi:MAG: glutamate--tRNA ligase, partial [Alphaproteobacteria bacterium]
WLGLDWDEEVRQSTRLDRYREAADRLRAAGRLYPCYETPEELELKRRLQRAQGRPPVYDRAALSLDAQERGRLEGEGRRPHWRFLLDRSTAVAWDDLIRGPQHVDPGSLSDPVLVRADGSFLYLLPSSVDDIALAVTHVIRGEDHVTNTGEQIQLIEALEAVPPAFAHFPLLRGAGGAPLSKRAGDLSIRALREGGAEPLAIVSLLACLGTGRSPEAVRDLDELVAQFDLGAFSRSSAIFDPEELDRLDARLLHHREYEEIAARPEMAGVTRELWEAVRGNIGHLAEVQDWRRIVEGPIEPVIEAEDRDFLARAAELLPPVLDKEGWRAWTAALKKQTGRKGRALFRPLRLALTGREAGPEMAALLLLIGRGKAQARLKGEKA